MLEIVVCDDDIADLERAVNIQSQPPKCYAFRRCGVSAK